jgi:hypothetical protein
MTKLGQRLIVRREALKEDSWTYGEWRQYIVFRDNGDACCVRLSTLPHMLFLIGLVGLTLPLMGAFFWWNGVGIAWGNVAWSTGISFALVTPHLIQRLAGWRLVVVVLTCTRKGDGSWVRDL